jgi:hypothetical protein
MPLAAPCASHVPRVHRRIAYGHLHGCSPRSPILGAHSHVITAASCIEATRPSLSPRLALLDLWALRPRTPASVLHLESCSLRSTVHTLLGASTVTARAHARELLGAEPELLSPALRRAHVADAAPHVFRARGAAARRRAWPRPARLAAQRACAPRARRERATPARARAPAAASRERVRRSFGAEGAACATKARLAARMRTLEDALG